MIEQYWVILFTTIVITALYFVVLMRVKKRIHIYYYRIHLWTYETRHNYLNALAWYWKIPLAFFTAVFLILDWFLNVLLTLPMWDLPVKPFELTTHRMKRYKQLPTDERGRIFSQMSKADWRRYDFAVFICSLLNKEDKKHC